MVEGGAMNEPTEQDLLDEQNLLEQYQHEQELEWERHMAEAEMEADMAMEEL